MSLKKPMGKTWGYWFKKMLNDMERQRYYKNHRCNHKWEEIGAVKASQKNMYQCSRCRRVKSEYY